MSSDTRERSLLPWLAVASGCLYILIAWLSQRFEYGRPIAAQPILLVISLFLIVFLIYLAAIRCAASATNERGLLTWIVSSAIVFRIIMLFSVPILEIDIYRYLWDGAVCCSGVNPIRYSPDQVRTTDPNAPSEPALRKIVQLKESDPAIAEILRRVHFGHLPTIYPPTSQAVFAAVTFFTPESSSVVTRRRIMKAWLTGFDIATLLLVIGLLRRCGKPVGMSIMYAWCPLLMKEIAGSGHLDAIAVFLTTLGIYLVSRLITSSASATSHRAGRWILSVVIAAVMALSVGAKFYPIVLAPLVWLVIVRNIGFGKSLIAAFAFVALTVVILLPMTPRENVRPTHISSETTISLPPPSEPSTAETDAIDPSRGVAVFLRQWEMNDLIFMIIFENLKPHASVRDEARAWFVFVPDSFRRWAIQQVTAWQDAETHQAAFFLTRAVTSLVFFVLAWWLAWRGTSQQDLATICETAFLTIAWFWLLCPTQNPWYWTWALPMLPFVRNRLWLAVSGLVFIYYLRFWFEYHYANDRVWGTPYTGEVFFDFIGPWIEFAPWLVALVMSSLWQSIAPGSSDA